MLTLPSSFITRPLTVNIMRKAFSYLALSFHLPLKYKSQMNTCRLEKEPNLVEENPHDQIDLLIFFFFYSMLVMLMMMIMLVTASDRPCCVSSGLRCDRALEVRPEVGYEPCEVTSPLRPPSVSANVVFAQNVPFVDWQNHSNCNVITSSNLYSLLTKAFQIEN